MSSVFGRDRLLSIVGSYTIASAVAGDFGGGLLACRLGSDVHLSCPKRELYMPLINLVVVLIVVGVGLWLINRFIPMASSIKTILNVVVVVAVS